MTAVMGSGGVVRRAAQVMGFPVSLAVRTPVDTDLVDRSWVDLLAELRWVDEVFSTYRTGSWASRMERGEVVLHQAPASVRRAFEEVLDLAEQARIVSAGAFDVRRPDGRGGTRLDLDGVVKGWAGSRASAHLGPLEAHDWCLSVGGDVRAHVRHEHSPPWRVGVEDPRDPSRVLAVVPLRDGAVATSGTAHRGAHLVDARTGRSPSGLQSVTVVAEDLTWADLDATAAYAHGPEALAWLSTRSGRSGVVVSEDGQARVFATPADAAPCLS